MSKSKTKTTQQTTSNATTTPQAPTWIQQPSQDYVGGVTGLMNQGAGAFTPSGPNALQRQAQVGASGLTGGSKGYSDGREVNGGSGDGYTSPSTNGFDLAQQLGMGVAGAGPNLAGPSQSYDAAGASARTFNQADLQPILNPYLDQVVDTSLADYDAGAGANRARMASAAANNGGLRNSNNAIRSAVFDAESDRGRGALAADARFRAYNDAAGILGQDSDRLANVGMFNAGQQNQAGQFNAASRNQQSMFNAGQQDSALSRALQAAGLLSGNASAQGQDTRANIGLQADLGNQQYQQDVARQQYPLQFQALMQQLLGYNPNSYIGQNVSATGSASGTSSSSGFDLATLLAAARGSPSGG